VYYTFAEASDLFGIDSQVEAADQNVPASKREIQSRFSVLRNLPTSLSRRLSLQADLGEGGVVESQVYTGILLLEDLQYEIETGRAYLPKSAFTPNWYRQVQQNLFKTANLQ
jgi:hypothetical protein